MTDEKTGTEIATQQRETAMSSPERLTALMSFADKMAECRVTVPAHLAGKPGDCMAIAMQADRWGMDPFAVAQKTHLINGTLGYEAQLVNAVITAMAPTVGRLQFEWFGPWEKIVGKFKTLTGKSGKPYQAPAWSQADEAGCGVRVWATLRGETEPRVLELLLQQATVRNSTLWASDPKQQLAYLATKRWARLYTPDVILGVYTPDELEQRAPIDVTPVRVDESASAADRLKSRIADTNMPKPEDVTPISRDGALELIGAADSLDSLADISEEIKAAGLGGDKSLRDAWAARRAEIVGGKDD